MIEKLNRFLNPTRQRYAWIIGAVIWLAWLVNIIGGQGILDLVGNNIGADFISYYAEGKIILMGRISDLYSIDLMNSVQKSIYDSATPGFYPFLNPPQYAFFMVPFAFIPYLVAYIVWILLGVICLWLSIRLLGIQKPLKVFLFSLTWFPVFTVVSYGLNSFFTLLVFCLTYYFWTKNKNFGAGLIFSIVLYKPQFLLFIGFLWLLDWQKSWKALLGLVLGVLIQISLMLIIIPEPTLAYFEFAKTSIPNFMYIKEFPIWNSFSVLSFWLALFPKHPKLSQILFVICAIIVSFFIYDFTAKTTG